MSEFSLGQMMKDALINLKKEIISEFLEDLIEIYNLVDWDSRSDIEGYQKKWENKLK